jgi:transporter family-2 protein
MNWIFLLLSVLGGAGLAFQAGVNGQLGRKIGTLETAFLAYAVGTLTLLCFMLFFGKGNIAAVFSFPKWKWFIGVFGALYIFIMVLSVPKIGTASAIIAAIIGQVIVSMIVDHFGLFGGRMIPINLFRVSGVILMFISLILFYKN